MYGTCETLCRLLREQYPAETPLNLIVWSPADIEALADGMERAVSEQDIKAVLESMDAIPEEQQLESGVSAGSVMDLIEQVKQAVPAVMVPAGGCNMAGKTLRQHSLNRLWLMALLAQPGYWLAFREAGLMWWQLNILFAFAVVMQVTRFLQAATVLNGVAAFTALVGYLPLGSASYSIPGLLMRAAYLAGPGLTAASPVCCLAVAGRPA